MKKLIYNIEIQWKMVLYIINLYTLLIINILIGYFIIDNFLDDGGKTILFGVFDGHGGRDIVDYLIGNFPKVI